MSIHHATAKRAAKFGIALVAVEGGYSATCGDVTNTAPSAAVALEQTIKAVIAEGKPTKKPRAPKAAGSKKKGKKAKKRGNSEDSDDEESDEGEGSKSVIKAKYKAKYRPNKDTCGDPLVKPVFDYTHPDGEDVDLKRLVKLGKDNGVDALDRWGHLKTKSGAQNVGMIRMNLVNVLRGKLRQGTDVTIGDKTVKGTKKAE